MGLTQKDLYGKQPIFAQMNTPGGITYHLGEPDGPTICMSPLKELGKRNQYCGQRGGQGTDHFGTGRCRWHGGNAGTHPSHGRNAIMADTRLREVYEGYLNDPDLTSLYPELALLRTILHQIIAEARGEIAHDHLSDRTVKLSLQTVEAIGRTVERVDKAQARHILTVASIRMLMTRAVDTAGEFVEEDRLVAFLNAWEADVMGSFAKVELLEG